MYKTSKVNRIKKKKIEEFFDNMSRNRDASIESDLILKYEQCMRQEAVIELLKPEPDDRILDVGCGNARDVLVLAKKGIECVGIDLSDGMVKSGKERLRKEKENSKAELLVGSATQLPFRCESFDKILCSEVIEHIPNYIRVIKEIARVLKRSGKLVITTPNIVSIYGCTRRIYEIFISWPHPYDKWFTKNRLTEALKHGGFEVEDKSGICYLPGLFGYLAPEKIKEILVKITLPIEKKIRRKMSGFGYMLGFRVQKIYNHSN